MITSLPFTRCDTRWRACHCTPLGSALGPESARLKPRRFTPQCARCRRLAFSSHSLRRDPRVAQLWLWARARRCCAAARPCPAGLLFKLYSFKFPPWTDAWQKITQTLLPSSLHIPDVLLNEVIRSDVYSSCHLLSACRFSTSAGSWKSWARRKIAPFATSECMRPLRFYGLSTATIRTNIRQILVAGCGSDGSTSVCVKQARAFFFVRAGFRSWA
jgi:hypothetical protein